MCSCCGRASYCEIYNEALYDLLHWTKEQLQVRWDAGRGFHVPNLAVKDCPSVDDMLNVSTPDCLPLICGPTKGKTHLSNMGTPSCMPSQPLQSHFLRSVNVPVSTGNEQTPLRLYRGSAGTRPVLAFHENDISLKGQN